MGFSLINHPLLGTSMTMETSIWRPSQDYPVDFANRHDTCLAQFWITWPTYVFIRTLNRARRGSKGKHQWVILLLFEYLEDVPKDFMLTLRRLKRHERKQYLFRANILFRTVHPTLVQICGSLMHFVGIPERDPSMNAWTYWTKGQRCFRVLKKWWLFGVFSWLQPGEYSVGQKVARPVARSQSRSELDIRVWEDDNTSFSS